jgi:hypothetical protein
LSDRFFQQAGFVPRVAMESSSNELIKQAVMAGMGVAVLSQHTIGLEHALKRLGIIDVEGFPITGSWFVAQRRGLTLLPARASFRRHLLEQGPLILGPGYQALAIMTGVCGVPAWRVANAGYGLLFRCAAHAPTQIIDPRPRMPPLAKARLSTGRHRPCPRRRSGRRRS